MKIFTLAALLAAFTAFFPDAAAAAAFRCEVLAVEGSATVTAAAGGSSAVREGDLLSEGDSIEVSEDGTVDLAYDRDWRNIVRLEGGSKVRVGSVSPAKLDLVDGAVFAKLKSLPQSSTFEITTPTAVAAVRGTEYRTVVRDGETEVFNFSPSKVFVYGLDPAGQRMPSPAVLDLGQKTGVEDRGAAPAAPAAMDAGEKTKGEASQKAIETKIERAVQQGRAGKIQTVAEIEQSIRAAKSQTRYDEESRVTDSRRRSFK